MHRQSQVNSLGHSESLFLCLRPVSRSPRKVSHLEPSRLFSAPQETQAKSEGSVAFDSTICFLHKSMWKGLQLLQFCLHISAHGNIVREMEAYL